MNIHATSSFSLAAGRFSGYRGYSYYGYSRAVEDSRALS